MNSLGAQIKVKENELSILEREQDVAIAKQIGKEVAELHNVNPVRHDTFEWDNEPTKPSTRAEYNRRFIN